MNGHGRLITAITIVVVLSALAYLGSKGMLSTSTGKDAPKRLGYEESADTPPPRLSLGLSGNPSSTHGRRGANILEASDRVQVLPGRAVDVVNGLRPAADSGDPKAALGIYLKLRPCIEALKPIDESQLRLYREKGLNQKALLEGYEARMQECEGASAMVSERGKWLEQAADAGNLEAQLLYVADVNAVIGDEADIVRNPERAKQWRTKALRYLDTLVSQGNVDAMLSLSGKYGSGFVVQHDPVKAYALARAARLARPDQVPEALIDSYRKQLQVNQQREAEDLGRSIYDSCCSKR